MEPHSYYFKRERAAAPELPLAHSARERYSLPDELLSAHGNLVVRDYAAAQRVAHTMNARRDAERFPESAVRAGELYAAALLQEMLRLIVASYLVEVDKGALNRAYAHLEETLGEDALTATLKCYVAAFPPKLVARGKVTPEMYLSGEMDGVPHRQVAFEGTLLLHIANENPALERFLDLFDDAELEAHTAYPRVMEALETFFAGEPEYGPQGQKLFDLLRAPVRAAPTSLEGQLAFLRAQWSSLPSFPSELFEGLMTKLLRTLDTLKEETKPHFGGGPGPAQVIDPAAAYRGPGAFVPEEYERFSPDSSWMPRVVMLAKSTFVWLGQLSKQYGREISRLDDIPDKELDELARRGFTGIWLIGLWERSKASKTIKNLCGNPDAVASAYSLYDYVIANDLGGFEAFETLKARAWQRGIRLMSDMVPNHLGIDSWWVVEHPEWFLQLDESPYPSYTFDGPDLSQDERVSIFLEDHYYDSSDAAVVFKRQDKGSGDVKYIYHGNDGTSMPWNDTAQIDYLNAEAREAVIQTILHVARLSPIVRFDAAMVLTKQHIQRLWYPEPGSGGAIASRAQYGSMSTEDFEKAIPQEFWREVVDRVAEEVPDTLLLAEAFWMMEGYFVRTLGMHRVYNSAFMHMFKNEDNAKYRQSIKNVLEFEPEILKRFVNFMNNPDEETAVAQFGKDDKYFGVCTVMVTMPGLPMFGHGQVEGYTEKYGMEYRRAKLDEQPDTWLIDRHRREIFPLLHRREQFAEVENFQLYDVHTPDGGVDENVFAYSNRVDGQASLVVFNNTFGKAHGFIRDAVPHAGERGRRALHEGLGLRAGERDFTIFRDQVSGLEFIRRSRDLLNGIYLALDAYKYQVFLDFREVEDTDGRYERLHDELGGRGVESVEGALEGVRLGALHAAFRELLSARVIRALRGEQGSRHQGEVQRALPERMEAFAARVRESGLGLEVPETSSFEAQLPHLVTLPSLETLAPEAEHRAAFEREMTTKLSGEGSGTLYAALVLRSLASGDEDAQAKLRLEGPLTEAFAESGLKDEGRARLLTGLLAHYSARYVEGAEALLAAFKEDEAVHAFLRVDPKEGVYSRDAYRELTVRLLALSLLELSGAPEDELDAGLEARYAVMQALSAHETRSQGRWDALTGVHTVKEVSAVGASSTPDAEEGGVEEGQTEGEGAEKDAADEEPVQVEGQEKSVR